MRIPDAISARVRRLADETIAQIPEEDVLVAVSGGPDSTALAILAAIRGCATLGHVNHHLGPQAHEFEQAVRALAIRCDVPILVAHVDPDAIRSGGAGLEAEARTLRYRALRDLSEAPILTAHTAHDRLDTILMRLVQGTGLDALDGPRREATIQGRPIHRPMLAWYEEDVAEFLAALQVEPVHDPGNSDPARLRNTIRPVARKLAALADRDALARSLGLIASDAVRLRRYDDHVLERITKVVGDEHWIAGEPWKRLEPEARATVVHGTLRRLGVRGTTRLCVDAASLAAGGRVRGSGVLIEHCGHVLRVAIRSGDRQPPIEYTTPLGTERPTETPLGVLRPAAGAEMSDRLAVAVSPHAISGELCIRSLRPDDRFVPFGRDREVRVAERLAKDGQTEAERGIALVLADDLGPIWVIGGRRGSRALVHDGGRRISFRWERWRGRAAEVIPDDDTC